MPGKTRSRCHGVINHKAWIACERQEALPDIQGSGFERCMQAARTRAERYGQQLHVSDPSQDELQGINTKVYHDK